MPAFSPLAGFSPNCCAVRVHTEHWADAVTALARDKKKITKIKLHFLIPFINLQVTPKLKAGVPNISLKEVLGRQPKKKAAKAASCRDHVLLLAQGHLPAVRSVLVVAPRAFEFSG